LNRSPRRLGTPAAADHQLWASWVERGYREDLQRYGVHLYLHHYVRSYGALMSILASQTLWASDVRCLNDSTEFEHGLPICAAAIAAIREPVYRQHARLILQGLNERFRHHTFVACFSTTNDLERQWTEYADNQRGFVITFDNLVLTALNAPNGMRLMPVEYGQDAQRSRARRAVDRALQDLRAADQHDLEWTIRARFTLLATELFFLCTSFKSEDWRHECEWRMIYSRQDNEPNALPIQTRHAGMRAVPYVALDLQHRYAQHHLPSFAAVRAGPRSDRNEVQLVQRYLREFSRGTTWEQQTRFD
jgi:hypothetical protein